MTKFSWCNWYPREHIVPVISRARVLEPSELARARPIRICLQGNSQHDTRKYFNSVPEPRHLMFGKISVQDCRLGNALGADHVPQSTRDRRIVKPIRAPIFSAGQLQQPFSCFSLGLRKEPRRIFATPCFGSLIHKTRAAGSGRILLFEANTYYHDFYISLGYQLR